MSPSACIRLVMLLFSFSSLAVKLINRSTCHLVSIDAPVFKSFQSGRLCRCRAGWIQILRFAFRSQVGGSFSPLAHHSGSRDIQGVLKDTEVESRLWGILVYPNTKRPCLFFCIACQASPTCIQEPNLVWTPVQDKLPPLPVNPPGLPGQMLVHSAGTVSSSLQSGHEVQAGVSLSFNQPPAPYLTELGQAYNWGPSVTSRPCVFLQVCIPGSLSGHDVFMGGCCSPGLSNGKAGL